MPFLTSKPPQSCDNPSQCWMLLLVQFFLCGSGAISIAAVSYVGCECIVFTLLMWPLMECGRIDDSPSWLQLSMVSCQSEQYVNEVGNGV